MPQSTELRDLTSRVYQALTRGDQAFFDRHVSRRDHVLAIGTDPADWWAGHGAITRAFKHQFEELGEFEVVTSSPDAYSDGDVGWMADRVTFRLLDGTDVTARLTAVFHKEDGEWKIVQWHSSPGVTGDSVGGGSAPEGTPPSEQGKGDSDPWGPG